MTNKKRKRSLSTENVENIEERQKEKSARKKYIHLPLETAEEKRRRVNEQERRRQKQIAEAIERLRSLNMPFNPNLPNHKKDSTMYTISTATDLIVALRKKLEEHGIAEPEQLELLSQSQQPVSEQLETMRGSNAIKNVHIKTPQSSAQISVTGQAHCLGETSRNYQPSNHNLTQSSNKLAFVSDQQQNPYGNSINYSQNCMCNQVRPRPITQPQTYAFQPGQGYYPGSQSFMVSDTVGINGESNSPFPLQPMTRGSINGYQNKTNHVNYLQCGPHDVTNQFSHALVNSPPPASTQTHMSKILQLSPPWVIETHLSKSLPSILLTGESQELFVTPSSHVTMPYKSNTTPATCSTDIDHNHNGNNKMFVSGCVKDSHSLALIDDFFKS